VKFIGFWEYCPEDTEKVIQKFRQMTIEREKGTEKFAKLIFGPFGMGGETKGFSVYETDDMDKLTNISAFYMHEMKFKFIPIQESSKAAELYLKVKK